MNRKFWIFLIVSAVAVVALPLAIDWLIIGNNFPSNVSNSDWVGFLGGYLGSILGCIISLVGILWTINFTREQNRADRELQVRPCFDIRYLNVEKFFHTKNWLGYVMVNTWDKDINDSSQPNSMQVGTGLLYLKNVGNGPATNISFQVEIENIKCEHRAYYTNQNAMVTTNSILPSETAELSIEITNSRKAPQKEDFVWREDTPFPDFDMGKFKIPEPFVLRLKMRYSDLIGNQFLQELVFGVQYSMNYSREENGKYHCDLHLEDLGVPEIKRTKQRGD